MIRSHSCRGMGLNAPEIAAWAECVARAGYQAIDLPVRDLFEQAEPADDVRKIIDAQSLLLGASPFPYDWRGGDERAFQAMLSKLQALLEYAQRLGVQRFYTRVSESMPEGCTRSETLAWHRDRIDRLASLIQKFDLCLGLETVGVETFRQGRPPLMANLKSVRTDLSELFETHKNLGLLVDVFHLHAANESLADALGPLQNRIVGVHVADLPVAIHRNEILDHVRALPGTSNAVPIRENLKELKNLNCRAPVMVETIRPPQQFKGLNFAECVLLTHESLLSVWPE